MTLPIIGELWQGILFIIEFFFTKAPRPVQFLIFLLMTLLVGNVIVGTLHLIGFHCDENMQPVKVSTFDISTNAYVFYETIIKSKFNEATLTYQETHPYTRFVGSECFFSLYNNSGIMQMCDNPTTNTSCDFYYNAKPTDNESERGGCVVCNHTSLGWVDNPDSILGHTFVGDVCIDNAYPRTPSTYYSIVCGAECDIPTNYMFSIDNGTYIRIANESVSQFAFAQRLTNAGAERIYTDNNEKSYRRFVGLTCTGDYNPRFALFGIDIFDYRIWILLTVLGLLVWGLKTAGQSR